MKTTFIIAGACGRMGKIIFELLQADLSAEVVGLLEHKDYINENLFGNFLIETCPDELLKKFPKAVIIDFTAPEATLRLAKEASIYGNPMVIGTTGFNKEQKDILDELSKKIPIFWAPNMSIGVNVLLKILPELVQMLGNDYDMEMVELHHNKKKDSPSGTALKLAECLAKAREWDLNDVACYHREGLVGERPKNEMGIQTIRGGDVVGVHTMYFMGQGERIEVTHQAHSRTTFAQGAIRAAKWLVHKEAKSVYTMEDIF